MAKNSVDDWSTTAGDNTDVGGINIAENCPSGNVNNAMREVMAQIADDVPTKTSTDTLTNKTFGDDVSISSANPYVNLYDTGATATHAISRLSADNNFYAVQTRDSSDTFVSTDYLITKDASGAVAHEWRIGNTEVARINATGFGLGTSPSASIHVSDAAPALRLEDTTTGAYGEIHANSAGGNLFIDADQGGYDSGSGVFIQRMGSNIATFTDNGMRLGDSGSRADIIRDEDDMASDDPNALATQQSIKAYNDDTTIGIDQTWQDMSSSRASNLTQYQNTTGKPIQVNIMYNGDFNSAYFEVSSNGSSWVRIYADSGDAAPVPMTGVVIPDQHYYRSSTTGGTTDPDWFELR